MKTDDDGFLRETPTAGVIIAATLRKQLMMKCIFQQGTMITTLFPETAQVLALFIVETLN